MKRAYLDKEYVTLRWRLELLAITSEKLTNESASKKVEEQIQFVLQNVKNKDSFLHLVKITEKSALDVGRCSEESRAPRYDDRLRAVVVKLVDGFFLCPVYAKYVLEEQATCSCKCLLRSPYRQVEEFLKYLVTQKPHIPPPTTHVTGRRTN